MDLSPYKCTIGTHRNKSVIWLKFPKQPQLLLDIKRHCPTIKWSASKSCWYVLDIPATRTILNIERIPLTNRTIDKLDPVNQLALTQLMQYLQLKKMSANTQKVYFNEFSAFLRVLKSYPVQNIDADKLRSYFLYCVNELEMSEAQLSSRINAIKCYFEKVLHRPKLFIDVPRPKKQVQLPKVLNQKEIAKLFEMVSNPKHQLMLKLCYGMGLRVSELVALKIANIDSHTMRVCIENAKGKKDRYVNLPESILEDLRAYYKTYHPKEFLFEGQFGGAYSTRSVQVVFKTAMQKANIRKQIGIHGLRHSYATHLIENGTDIHFIQTLLGHNSIKTTEKYIHVGNRTIQAVKSPLDTLKKENP